MNRKRKQLFKFMKKLFDLQGMDLNFWLLKEKKNSVQDIQNVQSIFTINLYWTIYDYKCYIFLSFFL